MLKRRREKPLPRRKFFRSKRNAFSFQNFPGRKAGRFLLEEVDTTEQASTVVVPIVGASETSEWSGRVYEIRFPPLHLMSTAEVIPRHYTSQRQDLPTNPHKVLL
jgi:hypothetical protein